MVPMPTAMPLTAAMSGFSASATTLEQAHHRTGRATRWIFKKIFEVVAGRKGVAGAYQR